MAVPAAPASANAGDLRNYVLVTGAYWADTVTDGAIRVLVLFYFYDRGYSPFAVASLFLFYEFFGIVTNLVGGWLAARLGLKTTLVMGLGTQTVALLMLALAPEAGWSVPYVMAAQALSGIAKDLTKMSSKSAVKLVVPDGASDTLFRWVAILTGSKNALKGVGFFLGGLLLTVIGFQPALLTLAVLVVSALVVVLTMMRGDARVRRTRRPGSRQMFSNNRGGERARGGSHPPVRFARRLVRGRRCPSSSARARLELLAGRRVPGRVGDRLRRGTGIVALRSAPADGGRAGRPHRRRAGVRAGRVPGRDRVALAAGIDAVAGGRARPDRVRCRVRAQLGRSLVPDPRTTRTGDKVAMNVGFYYMANAGGRLAGTVLSGLLYQWQGLEACLWASAILVLGAGALSLLLPVDRVMPGRVSTT